jgi:hypothetical protein
VINVLSLFTPAGVPETVSGYVDEGKLGNTIAVKTTLPTGVGLTFPPALEPPTKLSDCKSLSASNIVLAYMAYQG